MHVAMLVARTFHCAVSSGAPHTAMPTAAAPAAAAVLFSHAQLLLGLLKGHVLRPLLLHLCDAGLQVHQLLGGVLLGCRACSERQRAASKVVGE